jgi:hypothetical protein
MLNLKRHCSVSIIRIGASFEIVGEIDLSCGEKVVHWKDVDLDYTFVILTLRKLPGKFL